MALQIRRGTLAELQTITPELAEPIWTTDTHALYVGDGVTPGGWLASGGSSYDQSLNTTDNVTFTQVSTPSLNGNINGVLGQINVLSDLVLTPNFFNTNPVLIFADETSQSTAYVPGAEFGNLAIQGSWLRNKTDGDIFISPQDGNTGIYFPSDNNAGGSAVEIFNVDATGSIRIDAGNINKYWTFNYDGGLIFPDSTVQTTAYTGATNPFDQTLNTSSNVTFAKVSANIVSTIGSGTASTLLSLIGNNVNITDGSNDGITFAGNHKRIGFSVGTGLSNDTNPPAIVAQGNGVNGGYLSLKSFRWSGTTTTATQSSDVLGTIGFFGALAGGTQPLAGGENQYIGASILATANSNWTATNKATNLTFNITPSNTASAVTLLSLNNSGVVVGSNYNLVLQGSGGIRFPDGTTLTTSNPGNPFNQTLNTTSSVTFNDITVGGNTANTTYDYLTNNGIVHSSYYQTGLNGTGTYTLDTFNADTFRSAKYFVQLQDGSDIHVTEISLFHNGTDVFKTEYGYHANNGLLGTFSATIGRLGGNWIQLQFTPTAATNLTVRVAKTKLAV